MNKMSTKQQQPNGQGNSTDRGIRAESAPKDTRASQEPTEPSPIQEMLGYEERLWDKIQPGEVYELTDEDNKHVVPCHIFVGARRMGRPKPKP